MSQREIKTNGALQFEELADAFSNEIRNGKSPSVNEYAEQYPVHATMIQRLFPVLEMMEKRGTPVDDLSESGLLEAEMENLKATPMLRQLGDYRIIREIGRGGMGIVFEAEQESLGRRVALKLLPESAQFDERRKQRFQQEAQASAKLQHPNIVNVFGIGSHDNTSYFVMQFIDGHPLNTVLKELSRVRTNGHDSTREILDQDVATVVSQLHQDSSSMAISQTMYAVSDTPVGGSSASNSGNGARPSESEISRSGSFSSTDGSGMKSYWRNIGRVGAQVSSALEHAHANRILHRDIKPANLMIDHSGETWVTDFGLAKYFESTDLTRTGEVVGTLRYMSPEQLNGKADERSDIFGLGITLYEMAALQPAYPASDRSELMKQVMDASPAPLHNINRQIPRDLGNIIHKCITSEPRHRYQTASALSDDLQRFLNGEPVLARRVNFVERTIKWCRRRPMIAALWTALAISVLGGIAGIMWQWQKTETALVAANQNLKDAKTQTMRADKYFRQARESVDKFYTIISEQRLLREPGLLPLRKELMQEALVYYRNFADEHADDESLKLETGKSLLYLVKIESSFSTNPEIVGSCDEAIAIFSSAAEDNPDDEEPMLLLGESYSQKSRLLRRIDLNESIETLQKTIEIMEETSTRFPDSTEAKSILSDQFQLLGLAYESMDRSTGRTDRSLENYSKSYLLRKELQIDDPNAATFHLKLAESCRDLGITHRRMRENKQAIEYYDEAIEILEPVIEQHPESRDARRTLASIANSIGYFYANVNSEMDLEKAIELYQLSQQQYEALSRVDPLVIEYQDGVARAAANIGGVYQTQRLPGKAIGFRRQAMEIRSKLVKANPKAADLVSNLAFSTNGVGATLRDLDRLEESLEHHKIAYAHHVAAIAADPQQPRFKGRMVTGLVQLSRAYAATGQYQDAVNSLDEIDEFVRPKDTYPVAELAKEYLLTACKIGKLDDETRTEEDEALRIALIVKSKETFRTTVERGLDILKWITDDTDFRHFTDTPEGGEMLDWLTAEFSDDNSGE